MSYAPSSKLQNSVSTNNTFWRRKKSPKSQKIRSFVCEIYIHVIHSTYIIPDRMYRRPGFCCCCIYQRNEKYLWYDVLQAGRLTTDQTSGRDPDYNTNHRRRNSFSSSAGRLGLLVCLVPVPHSAFPVIDVRGGRRRRCSAGRLALLQPVKCYTFTVLVQPAQDL